MTVAAFAMLNPYPVLFHRALQQQDLGLDAELWRVGLSWRTLSSARRPDILHLHWIELLMRQRAPWQQRLLHWTSLVLYVSLSRLLGTRLVYTVHNVWQHESDGVLLYSLAHRWLLRLSSAVHVHDASAARQLQSRSRFRAPVAIIPHGNYIGWYPNDCSHQEARAQLGLRPADIVLLAFGQIRPYKGLEDLLQCVRDSTSERIVLLIAGRAISTDYEAQLVRLSQDNSRVHLHLEYVPDDHVQTYMNAADVAVLPYRRLTTSGAAILALSFGLPVIAPAIGPFPELLGNGAGWLYDPDAAGGLTSAIAEAERSDLPARRVAALSRARSLDWTDIGKQFAKVYRAVME